MSARQPAATAMAAMTMDHLSGGRFVLGLGVSGPQVVEGWYGMPFARPTARRTADDFEVAATVPLVVCDDVQDGVDRMRPFYALYFGGMGAKSANFHANVPIRMGYEAEMREVQELYLGGKKDEAAARIPAGLSEKMALGGPKEKIRDDLEAMRASHVTTLLVS